MPTEALLPFIARGSEHQIWELQKIISRWQWVNAFRLTRVNTGSVGTTILSNPPPHKKNASFSFSLTLISNKISWQYRNVFLVLGQYHTWRQIFHNHLQFPPGNIDLCHHYFKKCMLYVNKAICIDLGSLRNTHAWLTCTFTVSWLSFQQYWQNSKRLYATCQYRAGTGPMLAASDQYRPCTGT